MVGQSARRRLNSNEIESLCQPESRHAVMSIRYDLQPCHLFQPPPDTTSSSGSMRSDPTDEDQSGLFLASLGLSLIQLCCFIILLSVRVSNKSDCVFVAHVYYFWQIWYTTPDMSSLPSWLVSINMVNIFKMLHHCSNNSEQFQVKCSTCKTTSHLAYL